MTSKFKIKRVVVPFGALQRLTDEERHCLFLLGYIFNEIMALNKFAMMSNPKGRSGMSAAKRAGGTFNVLFFLRMLAGKLYEASDALRRKEMVEFLKAHCFPHLNFDGNEALRELNRAASQCKWLNAARNRHSMHYPSVQQTAVAMAAMQKGKAGFEFFIGDKHGETLYWSSDVMAGSSIAFEADGDDYKSGLDDVFDDLHGLSGSVLKITADSINSFALNMHKADSKYPERVKIKDVAAFDIPDVSDYELPYFVIMEKR